MARINLNALIYILIVLAAIWISSIIVYGRGGIVKRRNLEREIQLLQYEIEELKSEKSKVEIAIKNLKENRKYIEGYARELGYKRKDEIIFKFVERPSKSVDDD